MKPITFHRSILGQMAILAVVFVSAGIYTVAVRQITDNAPLGPVDPLESTVAALRAAISEYAIEEKYRPGTVAPPDQSPVVQDALRLNPDFKWFVMIDGRREGNASEPLFYEAYKLDRITREMQAINDPKLCTQSERSIQGTSGRGFFNYSNCASLVYYEFYGITQPLPSEQPSRLSIYRHWLWSYSQNFLSITGIAFLLIFAVVFWNISRIRRVATLVKGMPLDTIDAPLPSQGLPREVLPLVQAVNTLVAGRNAAQANRRFFLTAAAHEMRTPLTVVRTRLELLDESTVKDKLVSDVQRMTNLVNTLLTLVSIEDRAALPSARVDLVAACRKVLAERELLAAARSIQLRFEAAVMPIEIAGSAELVEVAVANLVDNAIAETTVGGDVVITVTADRSIVVRDHGPGLPANHQTAIFEPFVRYSSKRGGFGLGLAIVRAVMQAHGGNVLAENAQDGGAYFILQFSQTPRRRAN